VRLEVVADQVSGGRRDGDRRVPAQRAVRDVDRQAGVGQAHDAAPATDRLADDLVVGEGTTALQHSGFAVAAATEEPAEVAEQAVGLLSVVELRRGRRVGAAGDEERRTDEQRGREMAYTGHWGGSGRGFVRRMCGVADPLGSKAGAKVLDPHKPLYHN
jgi:hypothetical protein